MNECSALHPDSDQSEAEEDEEGGEEGDEEGMYDDAEEGGAGDQNGGGEDHMDADWNQILISRIFIISLSSPEKLVYYLWFKCIFYNKIFIFCQTLIKKMIEVVWEEDKRTVKSWT